MKTEQELRAWLAEKLRIDDVPDRQWDHLVEKGWVSDALSSNGASNPNEVLGELRYIRDLIAHGGGQRPAAEDRRRVDLPAKVLMTSDEEEMRAWLRNEWLAREARRSPRVRGFRRRWFAGYAKTTEERQAFMDRRSIPGLQESELGEVVEWLVGEYPWSRAQAEAFVGHDEVPKVEPIRAWTEVTDDTTYRHGRIILEVEPWVSEDTVRRTYRFLQGSMLPGKNRPLHRRVLEAARFIFNRLDGYATKPCWRDALRDWQSVAADREQSLGFKPGTFGFKDQDSMRRAVKMAEARILRPDYQSLTEPTRGKPVRVEWRNVED